MITKKQLEKERKIFSDLTEDETKDLIKSMEDYKVPKLIETTQQDDNCRAKATFILGKLTQTNEIIELIKEARVISENSYGEVDSEEIKLVKYLIDKEELLTKIKGDGE